MKNIFKFVLSSVQSFLTNTFKGLSIRSLSLSFLVWAFFQFSEIESNAQVLLLGNEPTYANTEIVIKKISDPIVQLEEQIGSAKINADGSFNIQLAVNETSVVYAYLEHL